MTWQVRQMGVGFVGPVKRLRSEAIDAYLEETFEDITENVHHRREVWRWCYRVWGMRCVRV